MMCSIAALGLAACGQPASDGLSGSAVGTDVDSPSDPVPEVPPPAEDASAPVTEPEGEDPLVPDGVVAAPDPKGDARADTEPAPADSSSADSAPGTSPDAASAGEITAYVAAHNRWRTNFGTPNVTWDATVAAFAQSWADHLAATDTFEHSSGSGYGENLWMGWGGTYTPDDAVNAWGNEVEFWPDTNCSGGIHVCCQGGWAPCGHFTQVVWSTTQKIGCGKATSASGKQYVSCSYSPPGNYPGVNPFPPFSSGGGAPAPTATTASGGGAQPTAAPTAVPTSSSTSSYSKTWSSIGLDIPDFGDPVAHVMRVSQAGRVRDIGVNIRITHSYVGDLSIKLVHPDGTEVMLRNQTGGSAQNIDATYGMGGIPVSGLSALNGKSLAGEWKLVLEDHAEEDSGYLDRVKLSVKYTSN